MKKDNLIETILERAFDYLDEQEIQKAISTFQRAFKRVYAHIVEDNMKSIKEYDSVYDSMYEVSYWMIEYLYALLDMFFDIGEKSYLEDLIYFCDANYKLYQYDDELIVNIGKVKAEALYWSGNVEESFEKLENLLQHYEKGTDLYLLYATLCINADKKEKAISILKTGIKKCEGKKEGLKYLLTELRKEEEK